MNYSTFDIFLPLNKYIISAILHLINEIQHFGYTMQTISGLGKIERERLAALIRGTKGTISVPEAASILQVSPSEASKMLSKWAGKGWLSRVRQGIYVPVPIESRTADVPLEK